MNHPYHLHHNYDDGISSSASTNSGGGGVASSWMEQRMAQRLQQRKIRGTLRQLPASSNSMSRPCTRAATILSQPPSVDFSSNDYLGLAHDMEQYRIVAQRAARNAIIRDSGVDGTGGGAQQSHRIDHHPVPILGATGSRLLSGDTRMVHELEQYICQQHRAKSALLCNSGYDANLSVVSTLPCTCILYDSYIHNSLHMGIRLWHSQSKSSTKIPTSSSSCNSSKNSHEEEEGDDKNEYGIGTKKVSSSFQHNNVVDLQRKLEYYSKKHDHIAILIESVYSMDGDTAPVQAILDVAASYHSVVVVDEAHGFGVFGSNDHQDNGSVSGTGVLAMAQCEQHPALAIAIYTFGKAAGCHGAVICCPHSTIMKEYFVNYAYPIIYSTALPMHSIIAIRCAYETITGLKGIQLRSHLYRLIELFHSNVLQVLETLAATVNSSTTSYKATSRHPYRLLPSSSPIQALIVPGNVACTNFCERLYRISRATIRLFPIKTPTVPRGQERVRIVLHAHNTSEQIYRLVECIKQTLDEMTTKSTFTSDVSLAAPQYSKL
jgi:8-amino-7-oxononanoate synthase